MSLKIVNGGNIQVIKDKFGNEVSMKNMWGAYGDFKELLEFYNDHKKLVGLEELRERKEYILKHGVNQRTELETIDWILGEDSGTD